MNYYELNKDKILPRQRQYYYDNKDKIYQRLNKIKCECGGYYAPTQKERHNATKAHCRIYHYKVN